MILAGISEFLLPVWTIPLIAVNDDKTIILAGAAPLRVISHHRGWFVLLYLSAVCTFLMTSQTN